VGPIIGSSSNLYDFEWPSRSFTYCYPFQIMILPRDANYPKKHTIFDILYCLSYLRSGWSQRLELIVATAGPRMTNHSRRGAWSGDVNHLNFGRHQPYLWNGWKPETRVIKFCTQLGYVKSQHTDEWQITLKRGVVRVTWPVLNFGPNDISETADDRVVTCMHR